MDLFLGDVRVPDQPPRTGGAIGGGLLFLALSIPPLPPPVIVWAGLVYFWPDTPVWSVCGHPVQRGGASNPKSTSRSLFYCPVLFCIECADPVLTPPPSPPQRLVRWSGGGIQDRISTLDEKKIGEEKREPEVGFGPTAPQMSHKSIPQPSHKWRGGAGSDLFHPPLW